MNRLRVAFGLAERFHQDFAQQLGEHVVHFGREWQISLAADILSFYCGYPQIDDQKIERMLGIFLDLVSKYGSEWNNGYYREVLKLAFFNKDRDLAKKSVKKLKKAHFNNWCYVCTYARPMLGYHILMEEVEEAADLVSKIYRRAIPAKYHWCFDRCQQADEGEMKDRALLFHTLAGDWSKPQERLRLKGLSPSWKYKVSPFQINLNSLTLYFHGVLNS